MTPGGQAANGAANPYEDRQLINDDSQQKQTPVRISGQSDIKQNLAQWGIPASMHDSSYPAKRVNTAPAP
jgi:hypothetical protein